jgi:hypothetical protein
LDRVGVIPLSAQDGASSDGSTVSIRCNFSHLEGCCGKSNHYTNNKVDQIDNGTKDTTTHLNRLHSIDKLRLAIFLAPILLEPEQPLQLDVL